MKAHLVALVLLLVAVTVLPGEGLPTAPPASHAPAFDHIFVILEENMDSGQIVGNAAAPFINDVLIKDNVTCANYYALDHGSLPDYLALVSGSEHREVIGDPPSDCTPAWTQTRPACAVMGPRPSNIADSIEASGRSWRAYVQTMGVPCRWQSPAPLYDVTHNPFVYFATVEGGGAVSSQRCRENDVDLSTDATHSLAADLAGAGTTPNFLFIVPDNAHNMHDGNVAGADRFLQDLFTGSNHSGHNGTTPVNIFGSSAWKNERSIAYIVWDEDSGTFRNQVTAIAVGNWVNGPQRRDGTAFDHYSLLRTWEAAWRLPAIGPGDQRAAPMLGAFNLLDPQSGGDRAGQLAEGHPDVYAKVEFKLTSKGTPATLLSLGASSASDFRLVADATGRLAFEDRAVDPPLIATGGPPIGSGWHNVELHVWGRGPDRTCEAFVDGQPMAGLNRGQGCPTGSALIRSYLVGDAGGGHPDAVQFRNLALATSPF